MNQRKGRMHKAAATDRSERVDLADLLKVLNAAMVQLDIDGESDAALRFEIFRDYLLNDYKGGKLVYSPKMLGL